MISKENAEHYIWGQECDGWRLVNAPELSVIHERMPPGTSEARHMHVAARQFFFVLAGTATLELAGQPIELRVHEGLEVLPGVPHQMRNESDAEIEFLVISHPASHVDRVPVEL